jgi:hypothetical protein
MATIGERRIAANLRNAPPAQPIAKVMLWELRRLQASRAIWKMVGVALVCSTFILSIRNSWGLSDNARLMGTSAYGQLAELVYGPMLFFGMILAFVATDAVTRDYKQRMHELLMTTAVPGWAYVGGRYLASLVVSLALAIVLLAAQLAVNEVLARSDPAYPPQHLPLGMTTWGVLVVPATIVVVSLSFALGTLVLRFSVVPKVVICIVWVILALDLDRRDLGWRDYWNPTGAGMAKLLGLQLIRAAQSGLQAIADPSQRIAFVLHLQEQPPDLVPWRGPYLTLAGLGILLVVGVALGFRRFREVLG